MLLVYLLHIRDRNNLISAEIFHCKPFNHYVAAVLLTPQVVVHMDSLSPGTEPSKEVIQQIERSFNLQTKYCVRSAICQAQRLQDCLVFVFANLDAVLEGNDISKAQFNQLTLRFSLMKSLITRNLNFPSSR